MPTLNNPFVTYGYKGSEYFCDREQETKTIITALENERNITLVSPRRMGKTGLIYHVFSRLEHLQPEVKCFYVDIFPTKNLQQLVQALSRAILGKLDTPTQNALRRMMQFFARFRPTISYDEITGAPTVSLDIAPNEEHSSLEHIFRYIQQSGVRCYVAIDEFQQILNYSDTGVEALFRSYIQFVPNVYFIFSGSQQHVIEQMFTSVNRPFFQSSQMVYLPPLDEAKYRQFANQFFAKQDRQISAKQFHYLYNIMHGTTWYVHVVLNRLYQHSGSAITAKLIDLKITELIEEQTPVFQNYYNTLTENYALVITAIAKEGSVDKPLSNDFITRHKLPSASSVKAALNKLEANQYLLKGKQGYYVYDHFFAQWLCKKVY